MSGSKFQGGGAAAAREWHRWQAGGAHVMAKVALGMCGLWNPDGGTYTGPLGREWPVCVCTLRSAAR